MEPIAAIATAQGSGGIAVVRLSGEGVLALAREMFSRKGEFVPNTMYAGEIDCGGFRDFGLCVYFRAPRSFTGEDVVEFHCHGGTEIARGVLKRAVSLGARPAERGEFTRRAFLNGKLSLSACEGMAAMIGAESAAEVRAGYSLYTEKLIRETERQRLLLTECLAGVEADVDFPEEDLERDTRAQLIGKLGEAEEGLTKLLSQYSVGKKIKRGVSVVLCGAPNAGKSTLFNALLGYDRAIVSPHAGTTRDALEGETEIHGVLFRLTDTAGIRESDDEVELEGVRRAENAARAADLIVYLREEGDGIVLPEGVPVVTVCAKCDQKRDMGCEICVSAYTGEGIEELKDLLFQRGVGAETEGVFLMEERHFSALKEAREGIARARHAAEEGLPLELCAEDMRLARVALGTLGGETAADEVIGEIFSKFCVGK